ALIERPKRLVYLSSGMHRGVRPRMDDLLWTQRPWSGSSAYAESKLCDILLAFAVARRWKDVKAKCSARILRYINQPIGAGRGPFVRTKNRRLPASVLRLIADWRGWQGHSGSRSINA